MQHKKQNLLNLLQRIFVNKYSFVLFVFFAYLIFFDDHNLIKRFKTKQEIKQLEQECLYYIDEIDVNKAEINHLKNDSVYLEKFAREKYYMKKDNEEVFILK